MMDLHDTVDQNEQIEIEKMAGLVKRGKTWHLRMRVPVRYKSVEAKKFITRSLKTDSEAEAQLRQAAVVSYETDRLDAKLIGEDAPNSAAYYRAIANLAALENIVYKTSDNLAKSPLDELIERMKRVREGDPLGIRTMLGGVDEAATLVSELPAFIEEESKHENRFKHAQQMRIWRNPLLRAADNLVTAIGKDRRVVDLTASDALAFKRLWDKKVRAGEVTVATANKDFSNMSSMIGKFHDKHDKLDALNYFRGLKLKDKYEKANRKSEFGDDWIRSVLLDQDKLAGLNDEARDILHIILETGCRQSEVHDTPIADIFLDNEYPHFIVQNVDGKREVKNLASERAIPLVGVALEAMRRVVKRGGFIRYGGTRKFSGAVNKFFRENNLFPHDGGKYSLGGLRHSWESRLKKAGYSMEDRGELMGHSVKEIRKREHYGDSMTLKTKTEIMRGVMFKL